MNNGGNRAIILVEIHPKKSNSLKIEFSRNSELAILKAAGYVKLEVGTPR